MFQLAGSCSRRDIVEFECLESPFLSSKYFSSKLQVGMM